MFLRWLEVAYRKSCASSLSSSYLQTTSQDKCFCSASSYSPGERDVYSQGKLVERTTSVIRLSLQAVSAKRDFSLCVCVCVCITSSLSINLPINGQLGCFHITSIINNAAKKNGSEYTFPINVFTF